MISILLAEAEYWSEIFLILLVMSEILSILATWHPPINMSDNDKQLNVLIQLQKFKLKNVIKFYDTNFQPSYFAEPAYFIPSNF